MTFEEWAARTPEDLIDGETPRPRGRTLGGPGSGHFGHAGRPGQVGGSAPGAAQGGLFSDQISNTPDGFDAWFAGSKVVDADGNPLRVYHGTTRGTFGDEWTYFTDNPAFAEKFALSDTPLPPPRIPTKVQVTLKDGKVEVEGFETAIPGLAITKGTAGDPGWMLTHTASGLRIANTEEIETLDDIVNALKGVKLDWTKSAEAMKALAPRTRARIAKAITTGKGAATAAMFGYNAGATGLGRGSQIVPAFLSMKNPLDMRTLPARNVTPGQLKTFLTERGIDLPDRAFFFGRRDLYQMLNTELREPLREAARAKGHDGIIFKDYYDGKTKGTSYITFSRSQARGMHRRTLGGAGSGNFGHAGRPGQVGGSAPTTSTGKAARAGLDTLIRQGGFSLRVVSGRVPRTGYMVSAHKDRERVFDVKRISVVDLARYIRDNRDLLKRPGNYLGGWVHKGKVFLDVSTRTLTPGKAMRIARAAKQLGIYDLARGKEILLKQRKVPRAAAEADSRNGAGDPDGQGTGGDDPAVDGALALEEGTRRGDEDSPRVAGGPGSGHFGHAGRPGQIGGSAPAQGGALASEVMVGRRPDGVPITHTTTDEEDEWEISDAGEVGAEDEGIGFHGTSSAQLDAILTEGLRPKASAGADVWLESVREQFYEDNPEVDREAAEEALLGGDRAVSVHVTPSLHEAKFFASITRSLYDESDAVVLQVNVPRSWADEMARAGLVRMDEANARPTFRVLKPIPPEWIVGFWRTGDTEMTTREEWLASRRSVGGPRGRTLGTSDTTPLYIVTVLNPPEMTALGGPGSGNFGHAGRPGQIGGSAPADGGGLATDRPRRTARDKQRFREQIERNREERAREQEEAKADPNWVPRKQDDIPPAFPFESQAPQYPAKGKPGIGYFKGVIDEETHVDALLFRGPDGKVRGILNHYPKDMPPYEEKGNVNIFVDPKFKRQGIATALVEEAERRFGPINFQQQKYTSEGRPFITSLLKKRRGLASDGVDSPDDHTFTPGQRVRIEGESADKLFIGSDLVDIITPHSNRGAVTHVQGKRTYAGVSRHIPTATVKNKRGKQFEAFHHTLRPLTTLGGPGSGNFGHAGRPGQVGGSAPSSGGLQTETGAPMVNGRRTSSPEQMRVVFARRQNWPLNEAEDVLRRETHEHALCFDKEGRFVHYNGDRNPTSVVPTGGALSLRDLERQLVGGTVTHNHPTGFSLSRQDVDWAIRYGLAEIRAVTPDGMTYRMQFPKKIPARVRGQIRTAMEKLYNEARMADGPLVLAGVITEQEAWHRLHKATWPRIAKEFGMTYRAEKSPSKTPTVGGPRGRTLRASATELREYFQQQIIEAGVPEADRAAKLEEVLAHHARMEQQPFALTWDEGEAMDDGADAGLFGMGLTALGGPGSGNFGHAGRPGQVGGSAPAKGGGLGEDPLSTEGWISEGGFEHTGIEWMQPLDKDGRPIPIKVSTVEEGAEMVLRGMVVEVKDAATAHTLVSKLADMAQEAKKAGVKAKDYDLCQVTVPGTNLFCAQSLKTKEYPKGVPRLEMPQLGGQPEPGSEADKLPRNPWDPTEVDGSKAFIAHLQGIGMKTETDLVPAAELRASQRELIGSKVGKMMRDTSFDPAKNPIFISSDGYVVDGHHRWAAVVGRDAQDGVLGDLKMNVVRVNAPISEVLHLATAWSKKFGIKQAAGVEDQAKKTNLHFRYKIRSKKGRVLEGERPVHRAADAYIDPLREAVFGAFTQAAALVTDPVDPAQPFDAGPVLDALTSALRERLSPVLLNALAAGGDVGWQTLRGYRFAERKKNPARPVAPVRVSLRFDRTSPEALAWVEEHATELLDDLRVTTKEQIRAALRASFETGAPAYPGIYAALADAERAELIAQTESMTAANEGQRQAWDQAVEQGLLDASVMKEWIGTPDMGMCDRCTTLSGTRVGLEEAYPGDGGDGPPLHPRCRCTEGISAS